MLGHLLRGGSPFAADRNLGQYVELELLSPLTKLAKGQKLANDQVWQIVPLPDGASTDPQKAAAVARRLHQAALEVLAKP